MTKRGQNGAAELAPFRSNDWPWKVDPTKELAGRRMHCRLSVRPAWRPARPASAGEQTRAKGDDADLTRSTTPVKSCGRACPTIGPAQANPVTTRAKGVAEAGQRPWLVLSCLRDPARSARCLPRLHRRIRLSAMTTFFSSAKIGRAPVIDAAPIGPPATPSRSQRTAGVDQGDEISWTSAAELGTTAPSSPRWRRSRRRPRQSTA